MRSFLIFLTGALLFLLISINLNSSYIASASNHTDSNTKRVIVKFKRFTPRVFREKAVNAYGATLSEELRLPDSFVINVPDTTVAEVVTGLRKNFLVEYAEEDFVAQKLEVPNDPMYADQWGLEKVKAPSGWNITHGSNAVDLAIVDTGVNYTHPDIASKLSFSVNCIYSSCPNYSTTDPDGHGTHVAGIATAATNNNIGVAGVSWDSRIMSVKVLNDKGSGYYSWIINGIVWAADNGAEVINLSLGGTSSSSSLKDAVDYAWNKGSIVVAAAGNSGTSSSVYPARYDKAIAVSATDENDAKAWFSNYGLWVDVAAPGVSILSTYKNGYEYLSGTSMSTPFVSGLAALIASQHSAWTNTQVRNQLETTSEKISGTGSYWTNGRIDVCKALGCVGDVMVSNTPTITPTVSLTNTPTPTTSFTPTITPSFTPTPIPTFPPTPTSSPTLYPTPSLTPKPLPWWCVYVPWHYTCR